MKATDSFQTKPIVIFDSGVGGLSIVKEVKQLLPHRSVVYCYDIHGFPYGSKTDPEVIERTSRCLNDLAEQFAPSVAVIACNTASTISLPTVRQELDFPVVGVVPAIKIAGNYSEKRCIGLLATTATISRHYIDQLIKDFASDCDVIRVGSNELVYMAENHLRGDLVSMSALQEILAPFLDRKQVPDAVVLGCTHFHLFKDAFQQISPEINWIDSGFAIAKRVHSLLKPIQDHEKLASKDIFMHTGNDNQINSLLPVIEAMGFVDVKPLKVKP